MITAITMWLSDKIVISKQEEAQKIQAHAFFFSFCLAVAQDIALIAWLWR